jgi:hypothetical protein
MLFLIYALFAKFFGDSAQRAWQEQDDYACG